MRETFFDRNLLDIETLPMEKALIAGDHEHALALAQDRIADDDFIGRCRGWAEKYWESDCQPWENGADKSSGGDMRIESAYDNHQESFQR